MLFRSRTDIFNVYFLRHVANEPIENYFEASYFDYCLLRLSKQDKELIKCYDMKVNELRRQNKLQNLTALEMNEIRYQMEVKCYGNSEIACVERNSQNNGVVTNRTVNTEQQKENNTICIEAAEYENLKYNSYCLEEVRKSFSYKAGLFLTKPVRLIREKLSK